MIRELINKYNKILNTNYTFEDLLIGQKRSPSEFKRLIWHDLYFKYGMTYQEIGYIFGRHHSAILRGIRLAGEFLKKIQNGK